MRQLSNAEVSLGGDRVAAFCFVLFWGKTFGPILGPCPNPWRQGTILPHSLAFLQSGGPTVWGPTGLGAYSLGAYSLGAYSVRTTNFGSRAAVTRA